jgi:ribonuclease P protein component
MRKNLTRKERIRKRSEFFNLFKSSDTVRIRAEGLMLFFRRNNLNYNRIALVPKKGFGGSVKRNRVKRIGKEIYRHMKCNIKRGYDLLILLYPGDYSFTDRKNEFELTLKRANLLQK